MKVVLDTNVVSDLMHRLPQTLDRLRPFRPGEVILTSPVAAEINFGLQRLAADSRRQRNLTNEYRRLREILRWEDWTEAAAERFGRLKSELAVAGELIEDMDIIVASIAVDLGAALATRNTRHMTRIEGLSVLDWSW